jgi:ribonuclease P/MRP protein subunit RPP40
MGGSYSDWLPVTSGVPQGSVLGPLLFLIYINDIPDVVNNLVKLFADDSKLLSVIKSCSDETILQDDLNKLVDWSETWRMNFNKSKC